MHKEFSTVLFRSYFAAAAATHFPLLVSSDRVRNVVCLHIASTISSSEKKIVFPSRKVEDVPGIFIPAKNTAVAPPAKDQSKISHFLGVKEDGYNSKRRRHSLSDPALLLLAAAASSNSSSSPTSSRKAATASAAASAALTPRSPYASTQAVLPFPRCFLVFCTTQWEILTSFGS